MTLKSALASIGTVLLAVVWIVIVIVADVVLPNMVHSPDLARLYRAKADIGAISQALELYKHDHGHYPSTQEGLGSMLAADNAPPHSIGYAAAYLRVIPVTPWGGEYHYAMPGHYHPEGFDLWVEKRDASAVGDSGSQVSPEMAFVGNWRGQTAAETAYRRRIARDNGLMALIFCLCAGVLSYLVSAFIRLLAGLGRRKAFLGINLAAFAVGSFIATVLPLLFSLSSSR